MQLDIFEDSRDVMLRNDVLLALQQRDAGTARRAMQALRAEFAQDACLAPMTRLADVLDDPQDAAFEGHAAALAWLQRVQREIEPLAQRLFGAADAAAWLVPLWRDGARRGRRLEFRSDCSDTHAAPLWLRAGEPAQAAQAVATIASWHRIPAPLAWMAEARCRLDGVQPNWGLLCELAWLSPARFDGLAKRLAEPLLGRLRAQFDAAFEGDDSDGDLAWFPAWVLTERPALAPWLGEARQGLDTAPERAMRLLLDLLHVERQGRQRELIARRAQLRDLAPAIFVTYMRSR